MYILYIYVCMALILPYCLVVCGLMFENKTMVMRKRMMVNMMNRLILMMMMIMAVVVLMVVLMTMI